MSRLFLTSDLHLGHRNIHKYRPFDSAEEHHNFVKEEYYKVIGKRDVVYFLGDIAFTKEWQEDLATWPGHKILILGNHDTAEGGHIKRHVEIYNKIHSLMHKKGCWLSHAPMHPDELRGKFCIHGHLHDKVIDDVRYRNVCLEHTEYKPILFDEVISELRRNNAGNI